jgi:hypothetical protein
MKFEDVNLESPNLHLVSGKPGSGKTVLLFSLADRLYKETGKDVYVAMRSGDRKIESFKGVPEHIHSWLGLDPPRDSIFLADDLQRLAHARRFQSDVNVFLDQLHALLRHDDVDYVYDTQTLSGIDRNNILRSEYRWYKQPYRLESEFGRSELGDEIETASVQLGGRGKQWAFLSSELYRGLVSAIPLPGYWSDELSRLHRRNKPLKQIRKEVKIF